MGGWAEECESCGELCYEEDMRTVGGELYCDCCADEAEDDLEEELETEAGPDEKTRLCRFCRKDSLEKEFIEKLEGVMCKKCAHEREVELAHFDDIKCTICRESRSA